jgi:hypothetical protein
MAVTCWWQTFFANVHYFQPIDSCSATNYCCRENDGPQRFTTRSR